MNNTKHEASQEGFNEPHILLSLCYYFLMAPISLAYLRVYFSISDPQGNLNTILAPLIIKERKEN